MELTNNLKVICINTDDYCLITKYKTYEVYKASNINYLISINTGTYYAFPKELFVLATQENTKLYSKKQKEEEIEDRLKELETNLQELENKIQDLQKLLKEKG